MSHKAYSSRLPGPLRQTLALELPIDLPAKNFYCLDSNPPLITVTISIRWQVIHSESLRLIKRLYSSRLPVEKQILKYLLNPLEDLLEAILVGNKKVFWYMFDLFEVLESHVGSRPRLVDRILQPMIFHDHANWIRDFFERYPREKTLPGFPYREIIPDVLCAKDISLIEYLVSIGMVIDGRDVNSTGIILDPPSVCTRDCCAHLRPSRQKVRTDTAAMIEVLLPLLDTLGVKYPGRIRSSAIAELLHMKNDIEMDLALEQYESART